MRDGGKAMVSLEIGGGELGSQKENGTRWLFPCSLVQLFAQRPRRERGGDPCPGAWVCPEVLGFISAFCQRLVWKPEWVVNCGEERRVGLVFVCTLYLWSLSHAARWELLPQARHRARDLADGLLNNSYNFHGRPGSLPDKGKEKMEVPGI